MDSARLIQEGQVNARRGLCTNSFVDASIIVPTDPATNLGFTSAAMEFMYTF